MLRVDLRRLILWLCLASVLVALVNGVYASYLVQRQILIANNLESNRAYAQKMAALTDVYLANARRELAYAASQLGGKLSPLPTPRQVAEQLLSESGDFNSTLVVNAQGIVLADAPDDVHLEGQKIADRPGEQMTLPTISEPFKAMTGRWVIVQTSPIFASDHSYLGYVVGTIYLHETNALHALLGTHFYRDGSYLYVVDRHGTILYHPDAELIGRKLPGNGTIEAVMHGDTGERRTVNREGIEMLTGYAPVPTSGWGIVAQRPTAIALQELNQLTWRMVRNSMPVLMLTLLVIWWLSKLISRPLRDLAGAAKQMDETEASEQIRGIRSWYYEAEQIQHALLAGLWNINYKMHNLRQESTTDALSGLLNRRGMTAALDQMRLRPEPASIVAVDIDHFKAINDTLGHAAGDGVIRLIADVMRGVSRSGDLVARVGGEEFVLVLPRTTLRDAARAAERLRAAIQSTPNYTGFTITISAGIAHFPSNAKTMDAVLMLADNALYHAKKNGRNVTYIVDENMPGNFLPAKDVLRDGPEAGDTHAAGSEPGSF